MWKSVYSKVFKNVTRLRVWNILIDVNNWQKWQNDIDYCKIEGDFKGAITFSKTKKSETCKDFLLQRLMKDILSLIALSLGSENVRYSYSERDI